MNLGDFRKYINYLATKENRGNTLTPEEFNVILKTALIEYVTDEYKYFEVDQKNTDVLGCIKKKVGGQFDPMVVTKGLAQLPGDYYRASSCGFYETKKIKGIEATYWVEVDILSTSEYNSRKNSFIIKSDTYPFCTIVNNKKVDNAYPNGYIEFQPKDISGIEFSYLSSIPNPNYDYCIGTLTLEEVYMPIGSRIVAGATNDLYLGTTPLYTNVYHVNSPTLPYTSTSIEMVFTDDQQLQIARYVIRQMGVNLKDKELFEAAEYLKQQENAGR